jgi:hypothetical protein
MTTFLAAAPSLSLAFDASVPPSQPYPGARGVMGYVGGNTPHVWSVAEWRRFEHLYQWPIWVGAGEANPQIHGHQAVDAVTSLGWTPRLPFDRRRAILLDYETQVDAAWIDAFAHVIWAGGFETMVYGSQSTVVDNPPKEGRWIALYNGDENIPPDSYALAHQFRANVPFDGTQVDLSVVTAAMVAHAGQGPRR